MTPDPGVWNEMMALVLSRQRLYDKHPSAGKVAAKARAAEIVGRVAKPGSRVLDVGAESFYRADFAARGVELEPLNVVDGEDMHTMTADGEYDGALAMHVLEHSPVPLYVLMLLKRAVRPGGFVYIAVPRPRKKWVQHAAHFTVLPARGWRRLIADSGLRLVSEETGLFGPKSKEHRFLCQT